MDLSKKFDLSNEQASILGFSESCIIRACPGSGKTRLLTAKLLHELSTLDNASSRVIAVTFTNRAADEIAHRLDGHGIDTSRAWTGTIHSFAIEWILRRFGGLHDMLRFGFQIGDEHYCRRVLDSMRDKYQIGQFDEIDTSFHRNGEMRTGESHHRSAVTAYRKLINAEKLIDFDQALLFAYELLVANKDIAATMGRVIRWICVDEYQDTQDLQYAILGAIARESLGRCKVFLVGDEDQAIYSSLGSMLLTPQELVREFGLDAIKQFDLSGNFRSTQKIVDFSQRLSVSGRRTQSVAKYRDESGVISFDNRTVHANGLTNRIASTIRYHLINGVPEKEICVLGPTWRLVIPLGRALVKALPDCGFDALGLSPIRAQNDSMWYQLARLFLTSPSPERYRARIRWSNLLVRLIEASLGRELPESFRSPRRILKLTNSIVSEAEDGLTYLAEVFAEFFEVLDLDIGPGSLFGASQQAFFEGAAERIGDLELDSTVESMRRMFQYPSGVVVNTCHGVKGEEFEVVIAFSLHNNRIPHHSRIEDPSVDESVDARNLLYVISSRAKRHLHLFAETGRRFRRELCQTTPVLDALSYSYDNLDDLL